MTDEDKGRSAFTSVGVVGLQFGLAIAIGIFAGRWADSYFGTSWLMWLGFAFGLAAGVKMFWVEMKRMQKLMDEQDPDAQTFPYEDDEEKDDDERDSWPEPDPK